MIEELKPSSKQLVYDLVTEAGVDTSDWANFDGEHPSSNPKYCYEWAFWDDTKQTVALCLWYSLMKEENGLVFQDLNCRKVALEATGVRVARARRMDQALYMTFKRKLPVWVIVVDGVRRGEAGADFSEVERRMLDSVKWRVTTYDADSGACRIVRSAESGEPEPAAVESDGSIARLARISYNSSGWKRPTGDARKYETPGTYNYEHGFGHEDWLFRADWLIDGWRYAFIQGLNNSRKACLGQPLDVTLYTLQPDKRRRLAATINGLETLSDEQAKEALDAFRAKGWLRIMQEEVRAIDGNANALGDPKWAENVLNVRYRLENVDFYPPDTFLPDDDWIRDRHRYMLYAFDEERRTRIERSLPARRGIQQASEQRRLFRRGTKPVEYTPEHGRMQKKLLEELEYEYGEGNVWLEKDFVDARVETEKELIYFEIKTDLDPRAVIRQAIGQILEYAYHPIRTGRQPDRLVIVGRNKLTGDDKEYLRRLCEEFDLPLSYRAVPI